MPQATTTTVLLGPVAELAGPSVQSAGTDKHQPSFDTLLRPAARSKSAVPICCACEYATAHIARPSATKGVDGRFIDRFTDYLPWTR